MSRFSLRLLAFLFPIICFVVFLEILVREIPNDYTLKHSNLISGNIEVLTLGNSHAMYGINPDFVDYNTFNASLPAQTINIDLRILQTYEKYLKTLKYIVIPVDYYSFYARLDDGNNVHRKFRYDQFMDASVLTRSDYLQLTSRIIVMEKGIRSTVKSVTDYIVNNETNISCDKNGYFEAVGQVDLEESGKIHSKNHNEYYAYDNYHSNLADLKKLIKLAQQHSWKVLLINCPTWRTYREHLYPQRIENIDSQCISLVEENAHVYYLDLFETIRYQSEDFYDDSHLGKHGAEKLSREINCLIKKIDNNNISGRTFVEDENSVLANNIPCN